MKRFSLEYIYLLLIPVFAGVGCYGGPRIGGMRHTAVTWPALLLSGSFLILLQRRHLVFPLRTWVPWYGVMVASFLWSDRAMRPNLQDCLQMVNPLIVGIVAGCVVFDEKRLETFFKTFIFCAVFILLAFCFFYYGPAAPIREQLDAAGAGYLPRPAALTATIAACVFVARAHRENVVFAVGWAVCFAVTLLSGSRMSSMAVLLLWCVAPGYRRWWIRPVAVGLMLVTGLTAFLSPVIQERFFHEGEGSIEEVTGGDFSTAGRSDAWPPILREAKKRPIFGHGVGSSVPFVKRVWPGMDKPHNDYLRVFYEGGGVGLALFLAALLWQLTELWLMVQADRERVNWPAAAAFLGFVSLAVSATTGNPIIYGIWFMNPLFAILGVAYSVDQRWFIRELS